MCVSVVAGSDHRYVMWNSSVQWDETFFIRETEIGGTVDQNASQ